MRSLVWFRVDLRTSDQTALLRACASSDRGVIGLFIISPGEWRVHDWAACKVELVLRTLTELSASLAKLNIPLLIREAKGPQEIPAIVAQVMKDHACDALHFNREYEINESRRDERVASAVKAIGARTIAHHDQCAIEPGAVRTQGDGPYTVFTPFKKQWIKVALERGGVIAHGTPRKQASMICASDPVPTSVDGFNSRVPANLWTGGEKHAQQRLANFCATRITKYKAERDFPAIDATSALSPYLAIGAISPRQCVMAAAEANSGKLDTGNEGATHWISEVVWREFYKHILVAFPRVCMGRAFKNATEKIAWSYDEKHFRAWCEGRTGYPIVDAAQRALLATGWMHNRLRMVSAMFLTKDLLIDWRWGEKFFMQHLVDGDLSQNNGGWQWSASTGTDAAPYFRIFNPASQSAKFDAKGEFIRTWVPELAELSDEDIHEPSKLPVLLRGRLDYPEPIVDHAKARDRVMEAFAVTK
jgi:deoxyribodipyrimidine photo-lyase